MAKKYRERLSSNGHKGHREGSRKERVHRAYDERGPKAARRLAEKLGLSEGTLKAWFWGFARGYASHIPE